MRNFVIINGVNSNTINGLGINELPPITKPEMRNIREEIDGRDGDITTNLGYSAYDKTITIGLFGTGYDINNIISFFNGEGTITFSNEDDKYYKYKIINQIDYEALLKFKQATITFHCQPFKYPLTETPLEIEYDYIEQTGETLTLNNTGESILKLDTRGQCKQDGEPTPDAPQQIHEVSGDNEINVCGLNLLNLSTLEDAIGSSMDNVEITSDSIKLTRNTASTWQYRKFMTDLDINNYKGKSLTISGISSNNTNIKIALYDSNKSLIGDLYNTLVIPNDTTASYIGIQLYQSNGTGISGTTTFTNLQVELGNQATTYEPYNGDTYEIDLGVENLFDKNNIVDDSLYNPDGTINTSNSYFRTDDYTYCHNMEYLTISGCVETGGNVIYYDENKNYVDYFSFRDRTLTIPNNVYYYRFGSRKENKDTLQLEFSSKANSYSPFGQTPIKMRGIGTYEDYFVRNSGKNLIQLTNQDFSIGDLHYSVDGGVLQSTGSRNPEVQKNNNSFRNNFKMTLSAGSYKVNYSESGTKTGTLNYYIMKYSDDSEIKRIQTTYDTFTLTEETEIYLGIYSYQLSITGTLDIRIMLCKDDGTAPIFEPYGTGQWCKYNAIGNLMLDGSESWNKSGTTSFDRFLIERNIGGIVVQGGYSNYFIVPKVSIPTNLHELSNNGNAQVVINFSAYGTTTIEQFKTWLSTHNTILDYVLTTPYLSLIEDETLKSQLDNIQNAMSYEGQTNVSQVNNDKPFIISAKALEKGSDEVVVNNIGNIYAKPLLALEGSGNVDIYLDDTQILKANVESKMNIDINTLEAYNPDTSALLNRQVIGNYNSMTFQPGNNKLTINGSLSKATITNYIRWL